MGALCTQTFGICIAMELSFIFGYSDVSVGGWKLGIFAPVRTHILFALLKLGISVPVRTLGIGAIGSEATMGVTQHTWVRSIIKMHLCIPILLRYEVKPPPRLIFTSI